jgi:hypothetical protein
VSREQLAAFTTGRQHLTQIRHRAHHIADRGRVVRAGVAADDQAFGEVQERVWSPERGERPQRVGRSPDAYAFHVARQPCARRSDTPRALQAVIKADAAVVEDGHDRSTHRGRCKP